MERQDGIATGQENPYDLVHGTKYYELTIEFD